MKQHPKFTTYQDCENAVGLTAGALPTVAHLPEKYHRPITGHFQAMIVCEAFNEDWVPNYNDHSQWKYSVCPAIEASEEHPSGFGFLSSTCVSWSTHTSCGSRLLFKSSELAICAQEQFPEIFKDYLLFDNTFIKK